MLSQQMERPWVAKPKKNYVVRTYHNLITLINGLKVGAFYTNKSLCEQTKTINSKHVPKQLCYANEIYKRLSDFPGENSEYKF